MSRPQGEIVHGRRRKVNERPPTFRGWISTDEDEIRRREWRGRTEIDEVRALDPEHGPFGDFQVASSSGGRYVVEIRSLRERINSCECHDSLNFLKRPLLPYQVEGVLHLAFEERALLADDMGLGKTVQAIAACALLRELRGIERVLVVSPASLKAEWEEQIAAFSDFPATVVFGGPAARRAAYGRRTFFTLCNYEQIVVDRNDILETFRPDVVILDEAQRIKNWQTKTANEVKKLDSRYAFVLTGTPLENRIDEIYSIVQFLNPDLLGPLFRFNREFYELDEKGRPAGYRNLDVLAERVSSVMLRRRKEDVESQLTGRTTKTFFVPMTEAQLDDYEGYEYLARRLAAIAARRPLTPEEFKSLQGNLGCMCMVCDTPYILDGKRRDCPKLEELERLLPDLLDDPGRVARMLRARALAERAEHKLKAAVLLEGGGFAEEARGPAVEAARLAAGCLAASTGTPEPEDAEAAATLLLEHEASAPGLPLDAIRLLSGEAPAAGVAAPVRSLLDAVLQRTGDAGRGGERASTPA